MVQRRCAHANLGVERERVARLKIGEGFFRHQRRDGNRKIGSFHFFCQHLLDAAVLMQAAGFHMQRDRFVEGGGKERKALEHDPNAHARKEYRHS